MLLTTNYWAFPPKPPLRFYNVNCLPRFVSPPTPGQTPRIFYSPLHPPLLPKVMVSWHQVIASPPWYQYILETLIKIQFLRTKRKREELQRKVRLWFIEFGQRAIVGRKKLWLKSERKLGAVKLSDSAHRLLGWSGWLQYLEFLVRSVLNIGINPPFLTHVCPCARLSHCLLPCSLLWVLGHIVWQIAGVTSFLLENW